MASSRELHPERLGDRMILEMGTPLSAEGAEILRTAREIPGFTNHGRTVTGGPVEIRVGMARGPGVPVVEVNRDDPYFILVECPKALQHAVAQTLDEHEKRMRSMVEQIAIELKAAGDVRIKSVEDGVEAAANFAGLRVADAIRAQSAEWKTRALEDRCQFDHERLAESPWARALASFSGYSEAVARLQLSTSESPSIGTEAGPPKAS